MPLCCRSAGHGDEIAIVDCNFPAATTATHNVVKTHVALAGVDTVHSVARHTCICSQHGPEDCCVKVQALDAVCSVLPLDFFVDCPCFFMAVRQQPVLRG